MCMSVTSVFKKVLCANDFEFSCIFSKLEKLACGLLGQAYSMSSPNAIKLIERPLQHWDGLNCMELARMAKNRVTIFQ